MKDLLKFYASGDCDFIIHIEPGRPGGTAWVKSVGFKFNSVLGSLFYQLQQEVPMEVEQEVLVFLFLLLLSSKTI